VQVVQKKGIKNPKCNIVIEHSCAFEEDRLIEIYTRQNRNSRCVNAQHIIKNYSEKYNLINKQVWYLA